MLGNTLETLYTFLGNDLISKENEEKLIESIFNKLETNKDYIDVINSIEQIEDFQVKEYLNEHIIEKIMKKFGILYKNRKIYYSKNEIEINLTFKDLISLSQLINNSNVKSEELFDLLSPNYNKRINLYYNLLGNKNTEQWNEKELISYLKNLKKLTLEFLEIVLEYGVVSSDEIAKRLNLKSVKSVSALVSACVRNAPQDKEKLIYKEDDFLKVNSKYRDLLLNNLEKIKK